MKAEQHVERAISPRRKESLQICFDVVDGCMLPAAPTLALVVRERSATKAFGRETIVRK